MTAEQKIVPCIWFNKDADEAVSFYLSTFGDSAECAELQRSHYPTEGLEEFQSDMAGEPLTIEFSLGGVRLTALNAGSEFRPTPMLSFIVNFDPSRDKHAGAHIDEVWERLSEGGEVLIDIGAQPYSPRYGWVQDRYGVSWQLMQTDPDGEPRPFLIPTFLFANANANRASEAIEFYASLFPDTRIDLSPVPDGYHLSPAAPE